MSNSTIKVIQPSGILDGNQSRDFSQKINQLVGENAKIIIIDFKNVTFMDSSGLGALVLSLKTIRSAGAKLFLCSINEQISMLFQLTSMDRIFEILSSREELEQLISGKQ